MFVICILPAVPLFQAFQFLLVFPETQGPQSLPGFLLVQQVQVCPDCQVGQLDPDALSVPQVQEDQFLPASQQVPCGQAVQGGQSYL